MKIGNLELDNNVVLAPMAGVSNTAFRLVARKFWTGLITTEMVSDKAILQKNERTMKMIEVMDIEKPISLQIFGTEKASLVEAAKVIDQLTNVDIIDFNMGCPVPKVTKNGAGSAWLLSPKKIHEMLEAVVKAVKKPVTVKIRTGWDEEHIYAVENAKAIESAGVSAVVIHGRTREQMYAGNADWDIIRRTKEAVDIPVIGNGDVFSPEEAKRMIDQTGVDGIMIGRAALGNPWILSRTTKFLQEGILLPEPTPRESIEIAFLHMEKLIDLKGEMIGIKEMRKHAGWYLKGLPKAAKVRERINQIESMEEMKQALLDYVNRLENN